MKRSELTQKIANKYPQWSRLRRVKESVGQQWFAPIAEYLEELHNGSREVVGNRFPQMSNLYQPSYFYYVQLESSFEFEQSTSDPYHPTLLAPQVTGDAILLTESKDYEEFVNSPPRRLSVGDVLDQQNTLTLFIHDTYISRVNVDQPVPSKGRIAFLIKDGKDFLLDDERATIQVRGISAFDTGDIHKQKEVSEVIEITSNGIYYTKNRYRHFNGYTIKGFNAETGMVGITWSCYYFRMWPRKLHYDLSWVPEDRDERNALVLLRGDDWTDDDVIQFQYENAPVGRDNPIMSFIYDKSDTIYDDDKEWDILREVYLTDCGTFTDYDVMPFTNWLFVLQRSDPTGRQTILVYNMEAQTNPMTNMTKLSREPHHLLDVDSQTCTLMSEIRVSTYTPHPLARFLSCSLSLEAEDGTKYTIKEDGSVVAFDQSYRFNKKLYDEAIYFTPPDTGHYLLRMDNYYEHLESDYDIIGISVPTATTIQEIAIPVETGIDEYTALFFDDDQNLCLVRKSDTGSYSVRKYNLHYDRMLVDFDRKVLLLRDDYSIVEVL